MHLAMLMPAPPARQPRSSARSPSGCCTSATRCPALATPPAGNGATAVSPQLLEVMQNVANGVLTASDAALQLNQLVAHPGGGEAEVAQRAEFPEVVWGADKGAGQILTALQRIADRQGMAAATRVPPATAAEIVATAPEATYHAAARMLVLKSATTKQQKLPGSVALIFAGTADATVVEECRLMLASCGCYAFKLAESGVMGMHRWGCRGEAGCIDKALQLRLQLQLTHCVRPGFLADWELQQRARLVLELGATLPISNYPSRPCLPALPAPPCPPLPQDCAELGRRQGRRRRHLHHWNGRRAGLSGGRHGGGPCHCPAHQHRLRNRLWGRGPHAGSPQLLRPRRHCGEH